MDRDIFIQQTKAKLDEWNAEIAKQEALMRGAEADMKQKYRDQLDEMREQRDQFEAKLQGGARGERKKHGLICKPGSKRRGWTFRTLLKRPRNATETGGMVG